MKNTKFLKFLAGIGTGLGIGLCFSVAMDNVWFGLLIGLGIGLCFGFAFSNFEKKSESSDEIKENN